MFGHPRCAVVPPATPRLQVLVRVIDLPLPAQVVQQVTYMPDNRSALVLSDDGTVVLLSDVDAECKASLEVSSVDKVGLFLRPGAGFPMPRSRARLCFTRALWSSPLPLRNHVSSVRCSFPSCQGPKRSLWPSPPSPLQALLRFSLDPTARYLASTVSDGRLVIHDLDAAIRHKVVSRDAHRRRGIFTCVAFSLSPSTTAF
jgi:hypothetical protein